MDCFEKIMLAENDLMIGQYLQYQLTKRGYSVRHVVDADDALKTALHDDDRYDLILMDVDLGRGLNGISAARKIRKEGNTPILFMVDRTDPTTVSKIADISPYGYISMSNGITAIDEAIKNAYRLFCSFRQSEILQNRLDLLIERMPIPFLLFSNDGTLIRVNKSWEDFWKLPKERYVRKFNLFSCAFVMQNNLQGEIAKLISGNTVNVSGVYCDSSNESESRSEGSARWIHSVAYPVFNSFNEITNYVALITEIPPGDDTA